MHGFEDFIEQKKFINLSPKTIKDYTYCFETFFSFLHEQNNTNSYDENGNINDILCELITQDTVKKYVDFLKKRNENITIASLNYYLVALRTLLNYLYEKHYMTKIEVYVKKDTRKIPKNYNKEELSKLINISEEEKMKSFETYRNWVLVNYLYATGNRPSTVINLKNIDIDIEQNLLDFRITKNSREYLVRLELHLKKILKDYMKIRKGDSQDYLFCDRYGNQMTEHSLYLAIRKYNLKHGVKKTTTKGFRHSFAKDYIRKTGDVNKLKSLMGHECIDSTMVYSDLYGEVLDESNATNNPLENFYQNKTKDKQKAILMKKR